MDSTSTWKCHSAAALQVERECHPESSQSFPPGERAAPIADLVLAIQKSKSGCTTSKCLPILNDNARHGRALAGMPAPGVFPSGTGQISATGVSHPVDVKGDFSRGIIATSHRTSGSATLRVGSRLESRKPRLLARLGHLRQGERAQASFLHYWARPDYSQSRSQSVGRVLQMRKTAQMEMRESAVS